MPPVGSAVLTVSSERARTVPVTVITDSFRTVSTAGNAGSVLSTTHWVSP